MLEFSLSDVVGFRAVACPGEKVALHGAYQWDNKLSQISISCTQLVLNSRPTVVILDALNPLSKVGWP